MADQVKSSATHWERNLEPASITWENNGNGGKPSTYWNRKSWLAKWLGKGAVYGKLRIIYGIFNGRLVEYGFIPSWNSVQYIRWLWHRDTFSSCDERWFAMVTFPKGMRLPSLGLHIHPPQFSLSKPSLNMPELDIWYYIILYTLYYVILYMIHCITDYMTELRPWASTSVFFLQG